MKQERGFALLAFLVMMILGLFLLGNGLMLSRSSSRTHYATRVRADDYNAVETNVNNAVNWFRTQSLNMITPFTRQNFYTVFSKGTPSVGANDVSALNIPTKIKINGSSNSVILTTDSSLGSSAFPASQNRVTAATFATASTFAGTDFGGNMVRATLVDAVPVDPSKDYGAPPAAPPETDFYPIYRLDALASTTKGAHLLGYMVGSLFYIDTVGFYGRDYAEFRQNCDSYVSSQGPYGAGNRRSNCPVGSNGPIRVHQNTDIYGSARTNGSITTSSPFGGDVCANISCSSPGQTCQGTSCGVPNLPTFQPWSTYCPAGQTQGNRTVSSNQTWTVAGSNPGQKCWDTVTISNNRVLTLTSTGTTNAYFIKTLTIPNNGRLNFAPSPASGTIYLYVETLVGNNVNGNQVFNTNNRPSQLRFYYLGNQPLTLNGNAAFNAAIVAPYAGITVSGNFTFQGGILATNLTATGSGELHYDETLGGSTLSDMNYRLRDKVQYYN